MPLYKSDKPLKELLDDPFTDEAKYEGFETCAVRVLSQLKEVDIEKFYPPDIKLGMILTDYFSGVIEEKAKFSKDYDFRFGALQQNRLDACYKIKKLFSEFLEGKHD